VKRSGKTVEFKVQEDRKTKNLKKLINQWPARSAHLQKLLPYLSARYVLEKIEENLPKGSDYDAYRTSLEIAQIVGLPRGFGGYAIRTNKRSRKVRNVDVPLTVIYVRANRKLRRIPKEIKILEKYSPWTVQTLPFQPKRSEALVISRKVSKREVEKIEKARLKDKPTWRKALDKTGRREISKDKQLKIPKKVHALPDVAFEAIRLEFGVGGMKAEPHWKPAIRELMATGMKHMLRSDHRIKRSYLTAGYTQWKHWPPRQRKIRLLEVKSFLPFQKKLGFHAKI
jgi:hypothetical protein